MNKTETLSRLYAVIVIACLLSFSGTALSADTLDFVFYQPDASFKDNVEAVTAIRSLEKYLSSELKVTVKGNFFQKETDMRNFIQSSKAAFVFVDIRYFIEHYKTEKMRPIMVPTRNGGQYTQSVVLVRKEAAIKSIFELKGKVLATNGRGTVNNNYLSNLIFESLLDASQFFTIRVVDTSNSAVMAVSYKEADVAIIDKALYDSNFPQKADFAVLFTSTEIMMPPLCIYEDNIKPEYIEPLKRAFKGITKAGTANDFLRPLAIDGWSDIDQAAYRDTERLLTNSPGSFVKDPIIIEKETTQQKMEPVVPDYKPEELQVFAQS
ncbi:PhnD/SsuA/transferrin family substrate-binding protein [bacterium]|nr:PhnD/SsuA/transferrin family substrate-binding protein [bacterium]